MIKLLKDGKVEIKIGHFQIIDYIDNEIISLLEDLNFGLTEKTPIILTFETPINEYYVICNVNELYIIDTNTDKVVVEEINLFDVGRELYNDITKQKELFIDNALDVLGDKNELKQMFDLNLRSLDILLNQENFEYKLGNITKNTLEALNDALYFHNTACVYDRFENVETFRLFGYNKTYIISNTKLQRSIKKNIEIINKSINEIAFDIYHKLKTQKKLKTTNDLLELLKDNLKEYGKEIN